MEKKDHIFFEKRKKDRDPVFKAIETACEGLIFISETDAPVEAFQLPGGPLISGLLLKFDGLPAGTPAVEIDPNAFFTRLTALKDWFDEDRKLRARKFLELKELLEENLDGLKAFRLGEVRVRYYIAGSAADGRLIGIRTSAVET